MFLLLALFSVVVPCLAGDHTGNELLTMIGLTPQTATQGKVTSLLGMPMKVEEGKKHTMWYYSHENTDVVIRWSNKSDALLQFSFKNTMPIKSTFDFNIPGQLKSGCTDLAQALKILGTPKDITIREKTQEMHYAYQEKVLRLFFRDRVLVDFCLY